MRGRAVDKALRNGPLTRGQREAVKLILSSNDRVVGVQGYAGTGKTTMLNRTRALFEKRGYEVRGLAPSASAARTLAAEAGVASETLQRFLARYQGVAEGRMTKKGEKEMRAAYRRTVLVVDEGFVRLHRPGPRPAPDRPTRSAFPAWCWSATRSNWTRSMPESRSRSCSAPG